MMYMQRQCSVAMRYCVLDVFRHYGKKKKRRLSLNRIWLFTELINIRILIWQQVWAKKIYIYIKEVKKKESNQLFVVSAGLFCCILPTVRSAFTQSELSVILRAIWVGPFLTRTTWSLYCTLAIVSVTQRSSGHLSPRKEPASEATPLMFNK